MKALLAQINPCVGDITNNLSKILEVIALHPQYDLIIFPELALCGYPPEDLLLYPSFLQELDAALEQIRQINTTSCIILGTVHHGYNAAAVIYQQNIQFAYKHILPNYGVFDEKRYFQPGPSEIFQFELKKHRFGIMICEDIWDKLSLLRLSNSPIDTLISIHASPYHQNKFQERLHRIKDLTQKGIHVIYLNQVGGQDGLIFDGQSLVVNPQNQITAQAAIFQEQYMHLEFHQKNWRGTVSANLEPLEQIYQGICLGLKDFMQKNGFEKAVLGLSGGIDSALTLAIACDAIGSKNIHAILMPSQYSADISLIDAKQLANNFGVRFEIIPIQPLFDNFKQHIAHPLSLTLQNLQARIRGILLMAYSNQHQALLLNTSNKSETAVGYSTLYGDMCGGFSPLQDVYKTMVYQLALWRNKQQICIPSRILTRAPAAELAPHQTDQDDLPPYDVLDQILIEIIENRTAEQQLVKHYDAELIKKIFHKIKNSEFKRFQASPGVKLTSVAFGKDWRFPISNHWKL